jgi:hypothetical protein
MGFLKPKSRRLRRPPLSGHTSDGPARSGAHYRREWRYGSAHSLINTSSRGLKRRASTQRTSLIGG